MNCVICNKDFDEFEGYISAFDREQQPPESLAAEDLDNLKRESVCSKECFKIHLKKYDKGRYSYSEISYCPSAKECNKLGNLRKLCALSSHIKTEDESILDHFLIAPLLGRTWCEPGFAGLIKSNMQLYRSNIIIAENIKKFDAASSRLSIVLIVLTLVLIVATIALYLKG